MAKAISIILSEMIPLEERTEIMIKADEMNLTIELINNLRTLQKNNQFNKEEVYKLLKEMQIKD